MISFKYKIYSIINPNTKGYKLIDLTGLSITEKEILRAKHRPHNYPTVYMTDNKVEPNALFIETIPTNLDALNFIEEPIN